MAELKRTKLTVRQERAVLVGVILPDSTADPREPLGELVALAKTAGAKVVGQILQKRHRVDAGTYVGSGKVIEIADLAIQQKADVIVFDNDLSPAQIGALERMINKHADSPDLEGIKVLDRSELILDIFATRARTAEAKLQVELAQMEYTYPRLTKMWGHLERIAAGAPAAGIGARGPGEQQLEIDRRLVRDRVQHLKKQIAQVQARKTREVARRTSLHPTVCIVGYTNAGKSTLFNTLTGAGTYADDKLFATLDTKTRAWKLDKGEEIMLSDTVGFVRDLPHGLVASFKATLEEAIHADLLLHVLDVGHPHAQQQFESVHEVLDEIGAKTSTGSAQGTSTGSALADKPEILLLNKIDTEEGEKQAHTWRTVHPAAIPISAKSGQGLDRLVDAVHRQLLGHLIEVILETDLTDGRLISFIEQHASVQDREFVDGQAIYRAILSKQVLLELSRKKNVQIRSAKAAE